MSIDTTFKFEPTKVDSVLQDFRTKIETAVKEVTTAIDAWNEITPDQLSTTEEHNAVTSASGKIDEAMDIFQKYIKNLNDCGLAIAQACTVYNSNSKDAAEQAQTVLDTMNNSLNDYAEDSTGLYNFG